MNDGNRDAPRVVYAVCRCGVSAQGAGRNERDARIDAETTLAKHECKQAPEGATTKGSADGRG